LFEVVGALICIMHVLQLRIKVIYKQLFWRTGACVWSFLTLWILC